MKKTFTIAIVLSCTMGLFFFTCDKDNVVKNSDTDTDTNMPLDITDYYATTSPFYGKYYLDWSEIGTYTRLPVESYTNSKGVTHWYEVVEIPDGNVSWLTTAYLAQLSGGYLVCPETSDENQFVFSLISDESYWYEWGQNHNYIMNGPPIGGFQEDSKDTESDVSSGWMWLSGMAMDFANWAVDEYCGSGFCPSSSSNTPTETDQDPRDNTQPNDANSGTEGYTQDAMLYGEKNAMVSTWGDFPISYGDKSLGEGGGFYAFVIEYESEP